MRLGRGHEPFNHVSTLLDSEVDSYFCGWGGGAGGGGILYVYTQHIAYPYHHYSSVTHT